MSDERHIADTATHEAVKAGVGFGALGLATLAALFRRRVVAWWNRGKVRDEQMMESFNGLSDALTKLTDRLGSIEKTIAIQFTSLSAGLSDVSDNFTISEANLRMVMNGSPLAMWECDAQGHCKWANNALAALFDLTIGDITASGGKGWLKRVIPGHQQRVWQEFQSAIAADTPYVSSYAINPGGKLINVVARGEILRSKDGRILTVRGTVEPVAVAA